MAIHYNLALVFEQTQKQSVLIQNIVSNFISEIPIQSKNIIIAIKNKQYDYVLVLAEKIKPKLELMGMTIAHEEIIEVQNWALHQRKRKEIMAIIKSIDEKILKAVKEMSKDFGIHEIAIKS